MRNYKKVMKYYQPEISDVLIQSLTYAYFVAIGFLVAYANVESVGLLPSAHEIIFDVQVKAPGGIAIHDFGFQSYDPFDGEQLSVHVTKSRLSYSTPVRIRRFTAFVPNKCFKVRRMLRSPIARLPETKRVSRKEF